MRKIFGQILDRCFAVVGAFLFCQFPLFMQQYQLLLQGHLAESLLQLKGLEQSAAMGNKTVAEYIQKFAAFPDPDFVHQAEWMQALQARTEALDEAYFTLQDAGLWTKPFEFLFHFDKILFTETFHSFSPGLPMSIEGLVYALCGIGIGILCYRLLRYGFLSVIGLFKKKKS